MGSVTAVTDGLNEFGLPYTEVTVAIDETLKGIETGTYTFRQFGLIAPRLTADGTMKIPAAPEGIPRYKVGESVLLFLGQPASDHRPACSRSAWVTASSPSDLGESRSELSNIGVFQNLSLDPAIESHQRRADPLHERGSGERHRSEIARASERCTSATWRPASCGRPTSARRADPLSRRSRL
jgi:hypothetical protein